MEAASDPRRRPIGNPRVARLAARLYPDPVTVDADEAFFAWIADSLGPTADILEIGAGSGRGHAHRLHTTSRTVTGIDIDPAVLTNPSLTQALLADFRSMPFPDASFDAVVANNVVEHLDDPRALVVAAVRVLRRGGSLFLKTPNLDHYVGLASRLTPYAFHVSFNRKRGRPDGETHPTRYRMNTVRAVRLCARSAGLAAEIRTFEGRPDYLVGSVPAFLAGVAYERLVNRMPLLAPFRCVIMARLARA